MKHIKLFENRDNKSDFIKECFVDIMDEHDVKVIETSRRGRPYIYVSIDISGGGYVELEGSIEKIKEKYLSMQRKLDMIHYALEKINSEDKIYYNISIANDGEKDCIEISIQSEKLGFNNPV